MTIAGRMFGRMFGHILPRAIAAQIIGLVVFSLILSYILVISFLLLFVREPKDNWRGEAGRIATVARMAAAAQSDAELDTILANARRTGVDVEARPIADLVPATDFSPMRRHLRRMIARFDDADTIDVLDNLAPPGSTGNAIVVRVKGERTVVFGSLSEIGPPPLLSLPGAFTLTILAVLIVIVSVYAARWITRPLSSIAAAARSFGRSAGEDAPLGVGGPREIAQVAQAMNDMRTRIRSLMDNRTRMLAAIGHDLRTPLTRLRLRAERLKDETLRDGMLREIGTIDGMLDETLTHLRDDMRSESLMRTDLPSLLQTICAEFSDVGFPVSYSGPERLVYCCRAGAVTRAITNVVENGTKHGSSVWVSLQTVADGSVQIDISDDGPGIPFSLRQRAFDPFFKGDAARPVSQRTGFGLGLSIARDIVKGHDGDIILAERLPTGLLVRLILPPMAQVTAEVQSRG